MDAKPRLGRGLTSLLGEANGESGGRATLAVEQIQTNPYQPRKAFDEDEIHHLSDSIKAHGVLQPLVVRHLGVADATPIFPDYAVSPAKFPGLFA